MSTLFPLIFNLKYWSVLSLGDKTQKEIDAENKIDFIAQNITKIIKNYSLSQNEIIKNDLISIFKEINDNRISYSNKTNLYSFANIIDKNGNPHIPKKLYSDMIFLMKIYFENHPEKSEDKKYVYELLPILSKHNKFSELLSKNKRNKIMLNCTIEEGGVYNSLYEIEKQLYQSKMNFSKNILEEKSLQKTFFKMIEDDKELVSQIEFFLFKAERLSNSKSKAISTILDAISKRNELLIKYPEKNTDYHIILKNEVVKGVNSILEDKKDELMILYKSFKSNILDEKFSISKEDEEVFKDIVNLHLNEDIIFTNENLESEIRKKAYTLMKPILSNPQNEENLKKVITKIIINKMESDYSLSDVHKRIIEKTFNDEFHYFKDNKLVNIQKVT